jgi:hypothetical protein
MRIPESEECSTSNLDLFTLPPTQLSIQDYVYDNVKAHPSFTENTVTFDITGDSSNYLDLASTELWVKLRLKKKPAGSSVAEDAKFTGSDQSDVGPANNILHSIFQQCQVYINGKECENSNSTYMYKAYLINLLSYNKEAKETFLYSEGFIKDTAANMDVYNILATTEKVLDPSKNDGSTKDVNKVFTPNAGLVARRKMFEENGTIQLRGRLHCDIMNINRLMLSNVNITIKLTRSKPEFYLIGTSERHFINIEETFLRVRRVKIAPSVMLDHAMALEKTTAKYPIKRCVVKQYTLPYNASKASINGIHSGQMPQRVILGFLQNKSFDGTLQTNPYFFKHFDVQRLSLKLSSKSVPYSSGIELDFSGNCYMEGYNTLFQNIRESGIDLTYQEYKHGTTLYAFDLSPDGCAGGEHFSTFKDGSLDLDIDFKTAVAESLTTIFFLEFDSVIELTKNRNIVLDYQV